MMCLSDVGDGQGVAGNKNVDGCPDGGCGPDSRLPWDQGKAAGTLMRAKTEIGNRGRMYQSLRCAKSESCRHRRQAHGKHDQHAAQQGRDGRGRDVISTIDRLGKSARCTGTRELVPINKELSAAAVGTSITKPV